jgi:acylphosphatase
MEKIIVKLLPDGSIKIEAEGYTGNTCQEATRFLERIGTVSGENIKPEYYETLLQVEGVKHNG